MSEEFKPGDLVVLRKDWEQPPDFAQVQPELKAALKAHAWPAKVRNILWGVVELEGLTWHTSKGAHLHTVSARRLRLAGECEAAPLRSPACEKADAACKDKPREGNHESRLLSQVKAKPTFAEHLAAEQQIEVMMVARDLYAPKRVVSPTVPKPKREMRILSAMDVQRR